MGIEELIVKLEGEMAFEKSANNPLLQFGDAGKVRLFGQLLPERTVKKNIFRENAIKFRSMIANASTRFSPPQKKRGIAMGSFLAELSNSDTAVDLDTEVYEEVLEYIQDGLSLQAVNTLLRFFDQGISQSLADLRELEKTQAISLGYVVRRGANNFEEIVDYPKFTGHRVTIPSGTAGSPAGFYDPAYDILGTLRAKIKMLRDKGYTVNRVITTSQILNGALIPNTGIQKYGIMNVAATSQNGATTNITVPTRTDVGNVTAAFTAQGIPVPEIYDEVYYDQAGAHKFMGDVFIMLCSTGRSETVVIPGTPAPLLLPNTLGYYAVGRATAQLAPGVATKLEYFDGKDARIEAMGWQCGFPIVQDPEAIVVLSIPTPV